MAKVRLADDMYEVSNACFHGHLSRWYDSLKEVLPLDKDTYYALENFWGDEGIIIKFDLLKREVIIAENPIKFSIDAKSPHVILSLPDNDFAQYLFVKKQDGGLEIEMYNTTTSSSTACDTVTTNTYTYTIPSYTTNTYTTTNGWTPSINIGDVKIDNDGITIKGEKVLTEKNNKENKMSGSLNFDFGPVKDNNIHLTPYGLAIKTRDNDWCVYDPDKSEIVNVELFDLDMSKYIYKMPVGLSQIQPGDIVIHRKSPVFVKGYPDEENRILVIDIVNGEEKLIIPTTNVFGFNFVTKVVSLINFGKNVADEANPFGNMLPFLLMKDGNLDPMMLMMLNKGDCNCGMDPMVMYALMKNGNKDDMLPFIMMMGSGKFANPFSK